MPMYSWLKRWASWLASCMTLRARSVNRSYMDSPSWKARPPRIAGPIGAVIHCAEVLVSSWISGVRRNSSSRPHSGKIRDSTLETFSGAV